jgi:hypothetical protein
MTLKLALFRGLPEDCFEGHEFMMIKPTSKKLNTLAEICDQVPEPANDVMNIPGVGVQQLNTSWLVKNTHHPIYRQMLKRFGWTSGYVGLELVCGYRFTESKAVYWLFCDERYQSQTSLAPSYYGEALLQPPAVGEKFRGNLFLFKMVVQNKRRLPQPIPNGRPFTHPQPSVIFSLTDESDMRHDIIIMPVNKAEIAHVMFERKKTMECGAFTSRMWRTQLLCWHT